MGCKEEVAKGENSDTAAVAAENESWAGSRPQIEKPAAVTHQTDHVCNPLWL